LDHGAAPREGFSKCDGIVEVEDRRSGWTLPSEALGGSGAQVGNEIARLGTGEVKQRPAGGAVGAGDKEAMRQGRKRCL